MAMTYEQAVAVQRLHEQRLLALPGVTGVGALMRDGAPTLVVTLDESAAVPTELQTDQLDGLPLKLERGRYRAQ